MVDAEAKVRQIGEQIAELGRRAADAENRQQDLLLRTPNLPHESVPIGNDPSGNRFRRLLVCLHCSWFGFCAQRII